MQPLDELERAAHGRHLAELRVLHVDALGEVLVDRDLLLEPREEAEEILGRLALHLAHEAGLHVPRHLEAVAAEDLVWFQH